MGLAERLERYAREYDRQVKRSLGGAYDQDAADTRDLLEEALQEVNHYDRNKWRWDF